MSLHSVGIRRADRADYAALIQLSAELLPKPHWYSQWRERLLVSDVFTYLAEDETIFGFVTAGPSLLLAADVGEVCGLFLSSDHRGSGMGKKLLVRGLSVLKRRGFDCAVIFVNSVSSGSSGGAERDILTPMLEGLGFVADVGERELNNKGVTIHQTGHSLNLRDYF
ncbi:MAG: GNAT superfamily N-acetyltransferase [Candidatus Azotimanducaceae bacterium]|jgi:GNAT superfamily N-acetyltransferase